MKNLTQKFIGLLPLVFLMSYNTHAQVEEFSNLNMIEGFSYGGFFENSYYFLSENENSWSNANLICSQNDGHLVTINSIEENEFVSNINNGEYTWIGLYQNTNSNSYSEPTGGWEWVTGEEVIYENWSGPEPNNQGPTDYENEAVIYGNSGLWNDQDGALYSEAQSIGYNINYILEIEAIYGCLNPEYYNYNPQANTSNDSCYPFIEGCIDTAAFNYDSNANVDDGSCMTYEGHLHLIDSLQQALAVFQTVEEEQDYSMSFDGMDDYLEIANNPSIQVGNQFSISFDLNIGLLTPGRIIEKGESGFGWGYGFVLENANIINFYLTGTSGQGEYFSVQSSPLLPDTWYRVTGVFSDNNYARLYIDGQLIQEVTTFNNNNQYQANSSSLIFGNRLNWGGVPYFFPFEGSIDNVQFWNTVLDSTQIQSYMKCPPAGTEEGLMGYWDFDEGLGDTVFDITGSGNHGVIYGAEFSEDVPESFNGCTDENALNFDTEALCDNSSCVYGDEAFSNLQEDYNTLNTNLNNTIVEATTSLSSLQQALDTWNTTIDLSAGWNMFGYGCPNTIDVADGLSNHTEIIIITKDNSGNVYMPEFGFNGIGDFTSGFGYQIKLTEAIEGFSLCDWYVNDIPEDNIVSLQEENATLQAFVDSVNFSGCTDSLACNYDINKLFDNGSCEYPNDYYDCYGNFIPQIGDEAFGGIVFYINETGEHGLVVSINEFQTMSWYDAIEFAENTDNSGFNDWLLPNLYQSDLIFYNIGAGASDDILSLNNRFYWMSEIQTSNSTFFDYYSNPSELNDTQYAHDYDFVGGGSSGSVPMTNSTEFSVIIIRNF